MLVKFSIKNYLSFRDRTDFDLTPSSIKEFEAENIAIHKETDTKVLKCAALYGSNNSGKSNLIKAMIFMCRFILNSSKDKQVNEEIKTERFKLSTTTQNQPSFFEIQFIVDNQKYRYGFEVDRQKVQKEYLYHVKKTLEKPLFTREGKTFIVNPIFITDPSMLVAFTRENALFLSVTSQFNIELATKLLSEISSMKFLYDTDDRYHINYTASLLEDHNKRNKIVKFLEAADLGFSEVTAQKMAIDMEKTKGLFEFIFPNKKPNYIINTSHFKVDENLKPVEKIEFNLIKNESLGTQKYFALAGRIIDALINGTVLIVDELDSRLHPRLNRYIVQLFNSKENNPNNAQFIFSAHNTNLFNRDVFRRDQIFLMLKDSYGATRINSLHNEHEIRKDASYEKLYLAGEFEAVPDVKPRNLLED